ncbi:OmpA family protein [Nocardiopsis dassonvillei]|uniref:OmpA family protein n=1 Tax=Nocardiopsis dassonvillei TaxID=2014 RepID=UPI003671777C
MALRSWLAVFTCVTLLVSGCTLPGSQDEPRPEPDSEGRQDAADYPEGPFVREGQVGSNLFRTRISVHHVERWEDRSVLRFTVTPLNDQEEDREDLILPAPFGTGALDRQHSAFSLVDPLGQAFYRPVRDESGETTIGSEVVPHWVMDADYEYQVHFPPLPEGTERITLVVNGSFGEFTGIPVIDGEPPAEPPGDSIDPSDISPGDTVAVPLREAEMTSEPEAYARDLYSIIEDSSRTRTSTTDEETIGLHADVLFDFDEATLTPEAEDVLAEVVQETRENADPSRPPIRVVGHTDGRGGDDYNQDLSERRAQAVLEVLEEGLGTEYEYETEGRGSEEPLVEEGGADDEEARATNRRVEISYKIRQPGDARTGTEQQTGSPDGPTGAAAPPAPFRTEDGEVIETAEAGLVQGNAEYELGVRPLYRDGAYLVGVFDIRHMDTGGTVPPVLRPLNSRDYPGGRFTAFSLTADGNEDVHYRAVRVGPRPTEDLERAQYLSTPQWPIQPLETGHTERVFVYFPAPPTETDAVTLHAADFGTFEVPVE